MRIKSDTKSGIKVQHRIRKRFLVRPGPRMKNSWPVGQSEETLIPHDWLQASPNWFCKLTPDVISSQHGSLVGKLAPAYSMSLYIIKLLTNTIKIFTILDARTDLTNLYIQIKQIIHKVSSNVLRIEFLAILDKILRLLGKVIIRSHNKIPRGY